MGDNVILLSGELGDAIYSIPTLIALGGGHIRTVDRPWYRPNWNDRAKHIRSLFLVQPWCKSFQPLGRDELFTHDLTGYRNIGIRHGQTIAERVAKWARVKVDTDKPWLEVKADPKTKGRIIVNRCPRWHGVYFPWKKLVQTYRDEMLFVGLESEWKAFCSVTGVVIEYLRTKDLLKAAQAIKGAELFIGNQSSCNALTEAMKKDSVLEGCITSFDCCYRRDNQLICTDGELHFEACGKEFHSEQYIPRTGCQVLVNNRWVYGKDAIECEQLARVQYIMAGIPHNVADIRNAIQSYRQLKAA